MTKNKIELVKWSSTFACGIKLIDDQHKELLNLVNNMFNHVSGNEEQEQQFFNKIIEEAFTYIKVHFSTEEKIMIATNFSGYGAHKKAHESFISTVTKLVSESQLTGKRFSLYSFTKFLKEWILAHIAVVDKQYFIYLKQIATHKADGKLSITHGDVKSAAQRSARIPEAAAS